MTEKSYVVDEYREKIQIALEVGIGEIYEKLLDERIDIAYNELMMKKNPEDILRIVNNIQGMEKLRHIFNLSGE